MKKSYITGAISALVLLAATPSAHANVANAQWCANDGSVPSRAYVMAYPVPDGVRGPRSASAMVAAARISICKVGGQAGEAGALQYMMACQAHSAKGMREMAASWGAVAAWLRQTGGC
jgi:hypothetical protein